MLNKGLHSIKPEVGRPKPEVGSLTDRHPELLTAIGQVDSGSATRGSWLTAGSYVNPQNEIAYGKKQNEINKGQPAHLTQSLSSTLPFGGDTEGGIYYKNLTRNVPELLQTALRHSVEACPACESKRVCPGIYRQEMGENSYPALILIVLRYPNQPQTEKRNKKRIDKKQKQTRRSTNKTKMTQLDGRIFPPPWECPPASHLIGEVNREAGKHQGVTGIN